LNVADLNVGSYLLSLSSLLSQNENLTAIDSYFSFSFPPFLSCLKWLLHVCQGFPKTKRAMMKDLPSKGNPSHRPLMNFAEP